jgi:hypothetical protein
LKLAEIRRNSANLTSSFKKDLILLMRFLVRSAGVSAGVVVAAGGVACDGGGAAAGLGASLVAAAGASRKPVSAAL